MDAQQPLEYLSEMRQVTIVFINLVTMEGTRYEDTQTLQACFKVIYDNISESQGCVPKLSHPLKLVWVWEDRVLAFRCPQQDLHVRQRIDVSLYFRFPWLQARQRRAACAAVRRKDRQATVANPTRSVSSTFSFFYTFPHFLLIEPHVKPFNCTY